MNSRFDGLTWFGGLTMLIQIFFSSLVLFFQFHLLILYPVHSEKAKAFIIIFFAFFYAFHRGLHSAVHGKKTDAFFFFFLINFFFSLLILNFFLFSYQTFIHGSRVWRVNPVNLDFFSFSSLIFFLFISFFSFIVSFYLIFF